MKDDIILDGDLNDTAITEMLSRRFKNLAKEYLQLDIKNDSEFVKNLKESSRFFSYALPFPINEMFIRQELAPLYWVYRSPLVIYLEEFFKISLTQSNNQNIHNSIKDFYLKWIMMNPGNEKKYFAASTINFIEKKASKSNFLYSILHAVILSYDNYFYNPEKSIELFNTAVDLVDDDNLNETFKEELHYLINIYAGFSYFLQKNPSLAREKFTEALNIKPYGITAKFYHSLSDAIINHQLLSGDIVSDLYDFDIQRIIHAIDNNNLGMMEYFLNNSVVSNFFYYQEFVPSVEMFASFLRDIKGTRNYDLNTVKINLTYFKELKLAEYHTPEFEKNMAFLESVLQKYSANENILFLGASERIQQKFKTTLEVVISAIKNKYYKEVQEKLKKFDTELQDKLTELELLSRDHEGIKAKLQDKMKHNIEMLEKTATENIALLEERISNLHLIQSLDPKAAFKNAMTYNFILSFTVFLMGGCAGYSNNFVDDMIKSGSTFSVIMTTGLKWGVVAFLIGFLIAVVASGLALLEGANQKQKLLQTINALKNEKEHNIVYLKTEFQNKEKDLEDKFKSNMETRKKYIDSLRAEREIQEKTYKEEAEQKIMEESKPILALYV